MRKGHGSSKVPNVKLRPAAAPKVRAVSPGSKWANEGEEPQEEEGDDLRLSTSKKPLDGVVICCTGIKNKPTLFAQAQDLGATRMNDFTDSVTHLIAVGPGSAKYQCALERKIPIMEPAWISRTFAKWTKGEDVSLEESEKKYRLPPFLNMWVAITGENDVSRRTELGRMINSNGGRYCKELNAKVTHLVLCSPPSTDDEPEIIQESEKIMWAREVNTKRTSKASVDPSVDGPAPIRIVWEEWLWDCVDWHGQWDEADYRIEKPRPKRKTTVSAGYMEEPSFNDCATSTQKFLPGAMTAMDPGPSFPKSENTDGSDEQVKILRRAPQLKSQPGGIKTVVERQLWSDIISLAQPASALNKGKGKETAGDETEDEDTFPDGKLPPRLAQRGTILVEATEDGSRLTGPSFLSRMSSARTTSFAQRTTEVAGSSLAQGKPTVLDRPSYLPETNETESPQIFAGLRFRTLGQGNADTVVNSLQKHGGTVIKSTFTDDLADADFLIVRLREATTLVDSTHPLFAKFRTECWVEHCVWVEKLCEANEHIAFSPLTIALPVPGMNQIRLVWSGLNLSETAPLKRLCMTLGITVLEGFSRKVTHLICPSRSGPKYEKALVWGIAVHDLEWVYTIARTGAIDGTQSPLDNKKLPSADTPSNKTPSANRVKEVKPVSPIDFAPPGPSPSKPSSSADTSVGGSRPPPLQRVDTASASPVPRSRHMSGASDMSLGSHASTSNLSSSLAALLGKRTSDSAEPEVAPPKKKSRPPSRAKTILDARCSASASPARPIASSVPLPPPVNDIPETAFDEMKAELGLDSMHVVYEDPTQQAERRKLLAMIGGEAAESGSEPPKSDTRRKRLPRKTKAVKGF